MFLFGKLIYRFCEWSREAEWKDGTKQMFIKKDWPKYFNEFTKCGN